ncbi:hypothetical protein F503_03969 [Ophiostoma piceae UAMH 11346]|uniref:Uncharacterized protein n=1 Tax=Ophiostoma piceae (strain UAMH 11346) TaxID=1262450 RepID=S3BME5_OPHP1|nr:hypothetical protein F503_03969 [Ophiostoma piceae UAMH 11346]
MATRILVQCRSQTIPGEPENRRATMANVICNFKWKRLFDKDQDRIRSYGQFRYGNDRVYVLIDNGELDSQDISTSVYRWDGKELISMPLNATITSFLQKYPFDSTGTTSRGYTDEEYKANVGTGRFNEVIIERIRRRRQWGQELLSSEEAFLKDHPELVSQS